MSLFLPLILAAAIDGRTPDQRQALVDLAYVLGEAHALRQACNGEDDQTWRARMNRMLSLEEPDATLNRRLVDNFNAGFMTRKAEHPGCDAGVAADERTTAERGRSLSRKLSGESP